MAAAKPTKQPCRILYRRCYLEGYKGSETLQSLIMKALTASADGSPALSSSWKLRLRETRLGDEPGEFTLMNHFRGHKVQAGNSIFGDLCRYQAGRQQAIVDQVDGEPEMAVTLLGAAERQEFLDGMLWWLASGNHVLAVQGKAARWRLLESYLTWLLTERAPVLDKKVVVSLRPDLNVNKGRLAKSKVKGINLTGNVPKSRSAELDPDNMSMAIVQDSVLGKAAATGSFWKALKTLVGDNDALRRIMDKLPDGEQLGFKLLLTFPSKRAMPNQVEFGSVQHAFDALDDADVEVPTEQGSVKLSDMVQQPEHKTSVLNHGGIWDRENLYEAFEKAWGTMVEQGIIAA